MRVEIADLQPLAGEVLGHREGLRIGEHPRDLRVEHLRDAAAVGVRPATAAPRPASSSTGSNSASTPARRPRSGAPWSGRSGRDRARCGTGNAARPASPGSRGRFPAPTDCPSPRASVDESLQSGDFRAESPAGGRRDAPASRGSGRRSAGSDVDGSQTRMRLRLGFSPFDANGPMTVTEPIHLFSLSL